MSRFSTRALVCLASVGLFTCVGCGRQKTPESAVPPKPGAEVSVAMPAMEKARLATPQEIARVADGTLLVSPDSGKQLQKNSGTPALVYKGRLYFVCCPACLQKCLASPSLLQNAVAPNGFDLQKLGGSGS